MAVIAIDWDHTLMNGKDWLPGAKDALKLFKELGHKVIIHSCNEKDWIEHHLNEAGIVVDHICDNSHGKPAAALYVDDSGYAFPYNGEWNREEVAKVLNRLRDKP